LSEAAKDRTESGQLWPGDTPAVTFPRSIKKPAPAGAGFSVDPGCDQWLGLALALAVAAAFAAAAVVAPWFCFATKLTYAPWLSYPGGVEAWAAAETTAPWVPAGGAVSEVPASGA
jgi:hypothetical protein